MRIYKNQISGIDPKYGSIKIFADQLIRIDLQRSLLIRISDQYGKFEFYRSA